ncbi:MAG: polysaccharide deacetylase family protein [Actinomycetota bacterium]
MTRWPDGARAAVSFSFDFDAEEVWIGEDPANADRPGILSQGTYGAKVAVPLVLDVLDRRGVRASFFIPGRVAERHPHRVEEIVSRGHEIGHHGYTHTSPTSLTPEDEERELIRGREVLTSFGADVRGYRSPSWDFSASTLDLLERHGFAYSSNLMDDIRPYRHEGSPIVEVPIQWILDDAPHFWFDPASWTKKISTVEEVRSLWEAEVLGIRELGGAAILTCHPQIIGRPGRIGFLEAFIGSVQALDDVWIATTGEIAEHVE